MQILDLSYNRVRSIRKQDLEKYTILKYLYLTDNIINNIDDNAFDGNRDLRTLDLSLNGFMKLPVQVFHLPYLERLVLSKTDNLNIVDVVKSAKPISSPLLALDISYNEIEELPDLGILPHLLEYSISGNSVQMSTRPVAGLCSLKILVNNNTRFNFTDNCDCWTLQKWLQYRGVVFTPFNCNGTKDGEQTQ